MKSQANPWNLTEREISAMHVLLATGVNQSIAMEFRLTHKGADSIVRRCVTKMRVANRVLAAIAFARWLDSVAAPARPGSVSDCSKCRGLGFVGEGA